MKPAHLNQILPGTGRGTARSVVEGAGHKEFALSQFGRLDPSVGFAATSPFRGGF
jgi:hypothetical protein